MSRHLYKQYIRIISKWPRDQFKHPDRDIANFISKEIERQFLPSNSTLIDAALCERRLQGCLYSFVDQLDNIALDELYKNSIVQQYPNSYKSGVFGLNLQQLQEASTEENRNHFGLVPKQSIVARLRGLFTSNKNKTPNHNH